jgi:Icc-related predicted phosphoesterase
MKILVIGDLHGRKPRIHFKNFDCIVQIGDVCDDSNVAPLYKKYFNILKKNPEFNLGVDEFFIREIGKKKLFQYERESLQKGNEILKYLDKFGKPIFMVAGNWDQSYGPSKIKNLEKSDYNYRKAFYEWYFGNKINPKLIKGVKNIKDCMYKNFEFFRLNFIGYGLSSGAERSKRRKNLNISKEEFVKLKNSSNKIFQNLSQSYKMRNKKLPTIFISHNIPYKTKLDVVKNKKSYANKKHLGSWIARKFCEKYQPLICVGGHMHEHFGKDKIRKTIVINAGFGRDANVLIDLDEKNRKIRKITFYKNYKKVKH